MGGYPRQVILSNSNSFVKFILYVLINLYTVRHTVFSNLYCNVFRARLTFHCMSISSKIKQLYAYFDTQIIEWVFWAEPNGKIRAKWTKHNVYSH